MANIYTSADQLIGKTPLLELTHIEKKYGLKAKLLAKLEANYEANKNNPNKKPSGLAARLEALQKQQEELMKRQQK